MKEKKNTIKTKFLISFICLVIVMLFFVGSLISLSVRFFFINNFYSDTEKVLNKDFIGQYAALSKSNEDFLHSVMEGVENQKLNLSLNSDRGYIILSADGKTLSGESHLQNDEIIKTENFKNALNGNFENSINYFGRSMIFCTPLKYKTQILGVICVTDSMAKVNSIISSVSVVTLGCCFLGLLISVILSFKISKIITKPIEDLTFAAKKIEEGNLEFRLNSKSTDEIGLLSKAFDSMSSKLKTSLDNLNDEKNKLSAIFSHLTDGVMVFSKEGKLYHYNDVAKELFNFDKKALFSSIFSFLEKDFKDLLDMGEKTFSYLLPKEDKTLKIIFAPFETSEKNLLCIIHDVSEEQNYITLQKTFAANASHELKTPLTVVKSYAQSIYDDDEMPSEIKKDFLNTILKETDRMAKIVKDMLTLSKNEKEETLSKSVFDIKETILSAVKNVSINAKEKEISFDLENLFEFSITADENLIYRCVENIISNAIKYTIKKDTIRITTEKKGNNIIMSVIDHGEKIPSEYNDKIFERFFRVDKARSRQTGGTGLGLAISRESSRKHGGDLYLDASFENGNRFVLSLPIA
ncbi:MAG: HAMP domain-containing protein [Clostridia bacterium]|nr:HAMP domain-containing protein [Clostridia bacterium]